MKNILFYIFFLWMLLCSPSIIFSQRSASCKKQCKRKFTVPASFTKGFKLHQEEQLILVLNEEFNDTTINADLWQPHPSFNIVYPTNVCNKKENIHISDGTAKMYVRYEPQYCEYWNYDSLGRFFIDSLYTHYTCGALWSTLRYPSGKFEIRCKIPTDPKGQYWPAFWLYGVCGAEIDVFEFLDDRREPRGKSRASKNPILSWHEYVNCNSGCWCGYSDRNRDPIDYGLDFHTYTVEWDEAGIKWYVDGALRRWQSFFADTNGKQVDLNKELVDDNHYKTLNTKIDKPMRVIANNGVHSHFTENNLPIEESVLEVDYIKAWTWVNPTDTIRLCNYAYQDENNPTLIAAGTVIISGKGCKDYLGGKNVLSIYTTGELIVAPEFKKDWLAKVLHDKIRE